MNLTSAVTLVEKFPDARATTYANAGLIARSERRPYPLSISALVQRLAIHDVAE